MSRVNKNGTGRSLVVRRNNINQHSSHNTGFEYCFSLDKCLIELSYSEDQNILSNIDFVKEYVFNETKRRIDKEEILKRYKQLEKLQLIQKESIHSDSYFGGFRQTINQAQQIQNQKNENDINENQQTQNQKEEKEEHGEQEEQEEYKQEHEHKHEQEHEQEYDQQLLLQQQLLKQQQQLLKQQQQLNIQLEEIRRNKTINNCKNRSDICGNSGENNHNQQDNNHSSNHKNNNNSIHNNNNNQQDYNHNNNNNNKERKFRHEVNDFSNEPNNQIVKEALKLQTSNSNLGKRKEMDDDQKLAIITQNVIKESNKNIDLNQRKLNIIKENKYQHNIDYENSFVDNSRALFFSSVHNHCMFNIPFNRFITFLCYISNFKTTENSPPSPVVIFRILRVKFNERDIFHFKFNPAVLKINSLEYKFVLKLELHIDITSDELTREEYYRSKQLEQFTIEFKLPNVFKYKPDSITAFPCQEFYSYVIQVEKDFNHPNQPITN